MKRWARLGVVIAAGALACDSSTAPGPGLAAHRAAWSARGIARYHFDFQISGFLLGCGVPARVYVTNGVVDSSSTLAGVQPAGARPCTATIDGLFDQATAAQQRGLLRNIEYDRVLGYPTRIDLDGPPDASGSYFVSNLTIDR